MNAMDFDDLLVRTVNVLELFPEVRARYAARLPPRARRRVPGHEPRAVPAAAAARAASTGTSRVVGDDDQSIYGFRGADIRNILDFEDDFPDADGRQARAELPLDADDPRRRQRGHRATTAGGMGKTLWTDLGEGDPIKVRELDDEHAEARFVVGEIERLVDEGVSRDEIAVFYRTNAQSRVLEDTLVRARDRLPGDRRHEVLRARRDQGRDRLPDAARQPAGRRRVHARRQLAAARDRADVALARARARRHDGHRGLGGRRRRRTRCPAWAPRRSRRSAASWTRWTGCASAPSSGVPVGELLEAMLHETGYLEALEAERTIEAQGRIENLEELVEVGARVRRRAPRRARTRSTSSCSRSRSSPTPTRAATTRAS